MEIEKKMKELKEGYALAFQMVNNLEQRIKQLKIMLLEISKLQTGIESDTRELKKVIFKEGVSDGGNSLL